jgi:hypothetical protein
VVAGDFVALIEPLLLVDFVADLSFRLWPLAARLLAEPCLRMSLIQEVLREKPLLFPLLRVYSSPLAQN